MREKRRVICHPPAHTVDHEGIAQGQVLTNHARLKYIARARLDRLVECCWMIDLIFNQPYERDTAPKETGLYAITVVGACFTAQYSPKETIC